MSPKTSQTVGLRRVAEIAGVSTATVSRVMNNPELVSSALQERVMSVVRHLGWIPDGTARAFSTRRTRTIGAVFPGFDHGDFARAIEGLQSELARLDYTLLLGSSDFNINKEFQLIRNFIERSVDAVLVVGEDHHHDLNPLLTKNNIPYLNMFSYNPDTHGTSIGPDNFKATYRLTKYLIELGHKSFGLISQDAATSDRARAREQGIQHALAEHALAVRPEHFMVGRWTIREGRELFRRIIENDPRPTVVFGANAYLAVGAILESQALGIRVPEEMSIVGYDDLEIMGELPIPITTVRVQSDEVGRRSGRRIVAILEGREDSTKFECEADIVVRASSGPPPSP